MTVTISADDLEFRLSEFSDPGIATMLSQSHTSGQMFVNSASVFAVVQEVQQQEWTPDQDQDREELVDLDVRLSAATPERLLEWGRAIPRGAGDKIDVDL